ncbi:MAG: Gfo/Idh/MocA family protein [Planctomycetota bacterium]|jgi:predicted dehydrogenase
MALSITGQMSDGPHVRVGVVGCGSHAFRNIYAALQFLPVRLVSVCDLDVAKAGEFARQFGADAACGSIEELVARDDVDAVLIVTNYDERGRPRYPQLACQALKAGKHVWMEKPPAMSPCDIEDIRLAEVAADRNVMVGFKKVFAPANEKAKDLIAEPEFGEVTLATFQYPLHAPSVEEMARYADGECVDEVVSFLDHLCHPAALMVDLLGMPATLFYQRGSDGAGAATFTFESGAVATLAMTGNAPMGPAYERTMLFGDGGQTVTVENNVRVTLHRNLGAGYGVDPSCFAPNDVSRATDGASLVWEPEFSLGQLYNKGVFLLGYWGELNEFARSVLDARPPTKGTLEQAWQVTRIFEAFAERPGKVISL